MNLVHVQLSTYLQSSEMYHAVNVCMRLENLVKVFLFPDVNIVVLRPLAADKLYAIDHFFRSVIQIVHNHDFVVGLQQRKSGEGANVAASSGSQLVAWLAEEVVSEIASYPVMRTEPTVIFAANSEGHLVVELASRYLDHLDLRCALPLLAADLTLPSNLKPDLYLRWNHPLTPFTPPAPHGSIILSDGTTSIRMRRTSSCCR